MRSRKPPARYERSTVAEASRTEPDSPNAAELRPSGFTSFAQRRPITAFLVGALGIGLPLLMIPAIAGIPLMPFLLPMTYRISRLGSGRHPPRGRARGRTATALTPADLALQRRSLGRDRVRDAGAGRSPGGRLRNARGPRGRLGVGGRRLPVVHVHLGPLAHQSVGGDRLERLHAVADDGAPRSAGGLAVDGASGRRVPRAALLRGHWTWSEAGRGLALVFGLAPFYRYLLGMHLLDTGGSLLAVAIQHASWNAANNLGVFSGIWQPGGAVVLLTVLLAVGRRLWRRERHPIGRRSEEATAEEWLARAVAGAGAQGPDMSPDALPARVEPHVVDDPSRARSDTLGCRSTSAIAPGGFEPPTSPL